MSLLKIARVIGNMEVFAANYQKVQDDNEDVPELPETMSTKSLGQMFSELLQTENNIGQTEALTDTLMVTAQEMFTTLATSKEPVDGEVGMRFKNLLEVYDSAKGIIPLVAADPVDTVLNNPGPVAPAASENPLDIQDNQDDSLDDSDIDDSQLS